MDKIISSQHFFVFSGSYRSSTASRPRSITVAFFALKTATGSELADLLAEYFASAPITERLLVVAPSDLKEHLGSVTRNQVLRDRLEHSPLGKIHTAVIHPDGKWVPDEDFGPLTISDVDQITQAGLRQIFASGGGLLTSHGGYHFAKPSGSHTEHFLRAGNVFVRSPQVFFIACACLTRLSKLTFNTIVVDTGSISPLGYALSVLRSRLLNDGGDYAIDSFGGYSGLPEYRKPDPLETVVIVSASTSGRLTDTIAESLRVPRSRQLILFYVGPSNKNIEVLCDLTKRASHSSSDGYIPEIRSWGMDQCPMCKNGQPVIQLEGDSFLPSSGTITQRLIVQKHGGSHLSPLIQEFYGLDAFRVRGSDLATSPRQRSMLIRYGHLLDEGHEDKRIREKLKVTLGQFIPLMVGSIVTFNDPESQALALLAMSLIKKQTGRDVELIDADTLAARGQNLPSGHALVIAGVVVGGRQLLSVSRFLRTLHEGGEIAYFFGIARPHTKQSWVELCSSLRFGPSGPSHYNLDVGWYVECDPDRADTDAWQNEARLLDRIKSAILSLEVSQDERKNYVNLISVRLKQLNQIGIEGVDTDATKRPPLFVPSDYTHDAPTTRLELNPNFAFWKFSFTEHESTSKYGVTPTEDEVYFTMATVLHNSRYTDDGKFPLFDEGGARYVLSPVNFHRFNDPIIQASIVRSARNMELDYRNDSTISAYVCDLILSFLSEYDSDQGKACVEFLISLAGGLGHAEGGHLRLQDRHIDRLIDDTRESKLALPLYARMLLSYIDDARNGRDLELAAPNWN